MDHDDLEPEYEECVLRILENHLDHRLRMRLSGGVSMSVDRSGATDYCRAVACEYGNERATMPSMHAIDVTVFDEWKPEYQSVIEEFGRFASALNYGCQINITVRAHVESIEIT